VLAVAAVLPLERDWNLSFAVEIQLAQNMAAILALDWALPWRKESFFML
jgi:hypothetical protein